jgi:Aspartyl protease
MDSVQTGWLKVPFRLDGIEGVGFLDTGASNTMITPGMARRLSLTDEALANDRMIKIHVVAGDDTPSHVHWFNTIQIGPVEMRHRMPMCLPVSHLQWVAIGRLAMVSSVWTFWAASTSGSQSGPVAFIWRRVIVAEQDPTIFWRSSPKTSRAKARCPIGNRGITPG